jgi:hypothetical protein
MPLPLAPIAGFAIRYGAVALATYAATRAIAHLPRSQSSEDRVNEGLELRRDCEQVNASGRWRRTIRLSKTGPGVEIDATALTRIQLRKVT